MSDLLAISALRLSRGQREVLRGLTFGVRRGELVALMGLSGSGKTTALRCVAALESFDGGAIALETCGLSAGPVPPESRLRDLRRCVGMVFQLHALFEHLSAIDNVMLSPLYVHGQAPAAARTRAASLLESLGVGARSAAYPRELSGGEAQRVAIARALAVDPPLLLMDEPTASLDPARRGALTETLRALVAEGRGLLVATHDVDFAREAADRIIVLGEGTVAEEGVPAQVLANPSHQATRDLLQYRPPPRR